MQSDRVERYRDLLLSELEAPERQMSALQGAADLTRHLDCATGGRRPPPGVE